MTPDISKPKRKAAPPSRNSYNINRTVSKGGVAILGPDNTVTIQQYFSDLPPEERARQEAQLRQSVSRKIATLHSQAATPRPDLGNPYYSTEPLGIGDKNRLCGRESFLAELIKRLQAREVTFLCGNGGVGKTSLIQAGVIPALLEAGHLPMLVTAGSLPLDRCIKEQIADTDLAQKMGLRSFLEFISGELEENQAIFILIDRLEEFFEQGERGTAGLQSPVRSHPDQPARCSLAVQHSYRSQLPPRPVRTRSGRLGQPDHPGTAPPNRSC